MAAEQEARLRIAPVVEGASTHERVIVCHAHAPRYLSVTKGELAAIRWAAIEQPSVSSYLSRYLAGSDELDLKTAVSLLMRLYQHGFVDNASAELMRRLEEFVGKGPSAVRQSRLIRLVDLTLVTADDVQVHTALRKLGAVLVAPLGLVVQAGLALALLVHAVHRGLPDERFVGALLAEPETLLWSISLVLSVATSILGVLAAGALAGAGARYVGVSLRWTALSFVRVVVHDDDAFMLPLRAMLRYRLTTLLLPWTLALLAWESARGSSSAALPASLTGAFLLIGLVELCPLFRGALVRTAEGMLATLSLLERSRSYLSGGLFSGLVPRGPRATARRGDTSREAEAGLSQQLWLAGLASWALVWLYLVSLLFADVLVSALPGLGLLALDLEKPERAGAAAFLVLLLGLAMATPLLRLVLIPAQNLAAMARLPVRRARRSIAAFYDKTMPPSEAVVGFLREIPILAGLDDAELARLSAGLRYRTHARGHNVVTRGDVGDEFFILADGQAQVVLGGGDTPEEVVDVLSPGDSFGEIALVDKGRRTATIRALSPCKTLVLGRGVFDGLFPEGSEARRQLTRSIRQVKLVLESQALSHLAPRQISELLRSARSARFQPGDALIQENTVGESAFLVDSGEVLVTREQAGVEIATLGRGALVGAISLIKDIRRTASVRAKTEVVALEIDKATFLRMCLSNMFVALLVSDLADQQLATNAKAG